MRWRPLSERVVPVDRDEPILIDSIDGQEPLLFDVNNRMWRSQNVRVDWTYVGARWEAPQALAQGVVERPTVEAPGVDENGLVTRDDESKPESVEKILAVHYGTIVNKRTGEIFDFRKPIEIETDYYNAVSASGPSNAIPAGAIHDGTYTVQMTLEALLRQAWDHFGQRLRSRSRRAGLILRLSALRPPACRCIPCRATRGQPAEVPTNAYSTNDETRTSRY